MGFFDWFKKKEEVEETKKIKLDEINNLVSELESKHNFNDFYKQVHERLDKFSEVIRENIPALKKFDLSDKKVPDRAKLIIQQNLDNYVNYLEKLLIDVDEIEKKDVKSLIEDVNNIFLNFEKKSEVSFQKATVLIGKELGVVRESIIKFSQDFKKILNENEEFLKEYKTIFEIKEKLDEIKYVDKIKKDIDKSIIDIEKSVKKVGEESEEINKNIEEIKKSKEYGEELKKKSDTESKKDELVSEIYKIKEMINFKKLSGIYHANEKEMKIIKEYQKNFKESFEKSDAEDLIDLVSEDIKEKIKEINNKEKEIKSFEESLELKTFVNILIKENKIKKLEQEIRDLEVKKSREDKKMNKTNKERSQLVNELREILGKINVAVEE